MSTRHTLAVQLRRKLRELGYPYPARITRAVHKKKVGERYMEVEIGGVVSGHPHRFYLVPRNIEQAALTLLTVMV